MKLFHGVNNTMNHSVSKTLYYETEENSVMCCLMYLNIQCCSYTYRAHLSVLRPGFIPCTRQSCFLLHHIHFNKAYRTVKFSSVMNLVTTYLKVWCMLTKFKFTTALCRQLLYTAEILCKRVKYLWKPHIKISSSLQNNTILLLISFLFTVWWTKN
jgi:hypothetical protein